MQQEEIKAKSIPGVLPDTAWTCIGGVPTTASTVTVASKNTIEHLDDLLRLRGCPSPYGYAAYSMSQLKEPISSMEGRLRSLKGGGQGDRKYHPWNTSNRHIHVLWKADGMNHWNIIEGSHRTIWGKAKRIATVRMSISKKGNMALNRPGRLMTSDNMPWVT